MTDETTLRQIAHDLELCDLIEVLGTRYQRRKARAHRKACYAEIHAMNVRDGLDTMTVDEIEAELLA